MQRIAVILLAALLILVFPAYAGSLDDTAAPTDPASRMYTLEQIYQAIASGTIAIKATGAFVEPETGPTPPTTDTHTLDQIYKKIGIDPITAPEPNVTTAGATDVTVGKTFITRAGSDSGQAFVSGTGGGGDYGVPKTGAPKAGYSPVEGEDGSATNTKGTPASGDKYGTPDGNTVLDNGTGLMWVVDPSLCGGTAYATTWASEADTPTEMTFANALQAVADLNTAIYAGHDDWRLPNVKELQSLVNYGNFKPVIGEETGAEGTMAPFTNTQSGIYWSSTTGPYSTGNAWDVNFTNGVVYYNDKTDFSYYVRPVRGGQ